MGSNVLALWLQVVNIVFLQLPYLALDDLRMTKYGKDAVNRSLTV